MWLPGSYSGTWFCQAPWNGPANSCSMAETQETANSCCCLQPYVCASVFEMVSLCVYSLWDVCLYVRKHFFWYNIIFYVFFACAVVSNTNSCFVVWQDWKAQVLELARVSINVDLNSLCVLMWLGSFKSVIQMQHFEVMLMGNVAYDHNYLCFSVWLILPINPDKTTQPLYNV